MNETARDVADMSNDEILAEILTTLRRFELMIDQMGAAAESSPMGGVLSRMLGMGGGVTALTSNGRK